MASVVLPCQPFPSCTGLARGSLPKKHKLHPHCRAKAASDSRNLGCKNKRTSSFTYRSSADAPIQELPGASFDQYMEDKGRVIRAIFPQKSTSQQLNEEEWIVKMPPIQTLFLTCQPVLNITARCISDGEDYPPEIPGHINKLLEVKIARWELQGLHADYIPSDFNIKATGVLYRERKGMHSWVKNQLDIYVSLVFPPLLDWVPEYVLQNILQSILRNYVEDINKGFATRLLADYNSFKRKTKTSV